MKPREYLKSMPYAKHLDIEVTHIGEGEAEGKMPVTKTHSSDSDQPIADEGALFSFADILGGAAILSDIQNPPLTINMRIDYLEAVRDDVEGTAEVVKQDSTTSTVDVVLTDAKSSRVIAEARGVYKVSSP